MHRAEGGVVMAGNPRIARLPQRAVWIALGTLVVAVGAGGMLRSTTDVHAAAEAGAAAQAVIFVPAHRGKSSSELTLPASLHPLREATLHARATGFVKHWHAEMGDHVKAGQVLAELEVPELDREFEQAQANLSRVKAELELARSTAARYRSLLSDDAVSAQEVDERTGALAARESEYRALQGRLRQLDSLRGFQKVVAPFAGTVTARNVELGSLVTAGAGTSWLYKLAQNDTLRVMVSVPQGHLAASRAGTHAEVLVPELGPAPVPATVVRNAGAFDTATRTLLTELRVANPEGRILPGMYGQVRFHLESAAAPLVVPVNALLVGGDGPRVAVVDPGDVVRIRKVKLGRDLGKQIEILEGLSDDERVVANPRDNLEEGSKVRPVPAPKHDDKDKKEKPAQAEPAKKDASAAR